MGKENNPQTVFDIEKILTSFVQSLSTASKQLQKESENNKDIPYFYHIPKMSLSLQMSLSHSKGKTKGLFVFGSKSKKMEEITSKMDIEIVAVPRNLASITENIE